MQWRITPYATALLLSAAITAVVAIAVWYRRTARGGATLFWFILAVIEWQLTGACEAAAVGIPAKILWSKICYVGTLSSPVLLATFAFQYSLREERLTRRRLALLWVVPIISFGLAITNEWHHLIWTSFTPFSDPASNILIYGHGTWFWIMVTYIYALLCAATAALILAAVRYRHLYRRQVVLLLLAMPFPWMGNMLYVFNWGPFPGQDLTPVSFALTGALLAANLYAYRFLDLVPMARDAVVETMKDGILVLDAEDRVADINPAACRLIQLDGHCIGTRIDTVLAAWPELAESGRAPECPPVEIVLGGIPPRHVDAQVSNLHDRHGAISGRIVVLRDVTERARVEEELRQHREHLEELVEARTSELRQEIAERVRVEAIRAQAEESLRLAQQEWEEIFQAIGHPTLILDPQHNVIAANRATVRVTGKPLGELVGKKCHEVFHGTVTPPKSCPLEQMRLSGHVETADMEVEAIGGVFMVSCTPVLDEQGELQKVIHIATDITERKRAESNLHRRNLELELLYQTGKQVASSLELDQVVADLLEAVRRLLDAKACSLWLLDPQTDELVCQKAVGPDSGRAAGWRLSRGQGVAGWVFDRGQSLVVSDARTDSRHHSSVGEAIGWEIRSLLAAPLRVKNGLLGVIEVIDEQADRFTGDSLRVLESLAATAAIALENARLYDQTRRDAETNALLLREVNHRVKNNLAAIMGMLHVERRYAEQSPIRRTYQASIDDLLGRIKGLAAVHETLSTSRWAPLPLDRLVRKIVDTALQALPSDKRVATDISATTPVYVSPEQAHNLSIVINELATNVVKYAARPRETARLGVCIVLEHGGEMIRLEFRDDGPGFPEKVLRAECDGAGLYLVRNTVRWSLRGETEIHNDHGAVVTVRFPKAVE